MVIQKNVKRTARSFGRRIYSEPSCLPQLDVVVTVVKHQQKLQSSVFQVPEKGEHTFTEGPDIHLYMLN